MQAYSREHPYCYSYLQCCCQPSAPSYSPQSHQYQSQFQPFFEGQLQKPFQSSFSIESLLGGEKTREASTPSFGSAPAYSKQTGLDSPVEGKLKELVERRRNNSSEVLNNFHKQERSTTKAELQKEAHLAGEPASASQEDKKGLMYTRFKRKRPRTMFTLYQLERMEGEFLRRQYITGNQRLQLASELQLTETQVRVWFQNRRIKWRKHMMKRQFEGYSDLCRRK